MKVVDTVAKINSYDSFIFKKQMSFLTIVTYFDSQKMDSKSKH